MNLDNAPTQAAENRWGPDESHLPYHLLQITNTPALYLYNRAFNDSHHSTYGFFLAPIENSRSSTYRLRFSSRLWVSCSFFSLINKVWPGHCPFYLQKLKNGTQKEGRAKVGFGAKLHPNNLLTRFCHSSFRFPHIRENSNNSHKLILDLNLRCW